MISIDELTKRFGPSHVVAPYGDCLVVQGSEFDPDWEAELGDLGYACYFGDLDAHAVTFVQLKQSKSGYMLAGPVWSVADEVELLEEYDRFEGLTCNFCKMLVGVPRFKTRSIKSVNQKLKRLLRRRANSEPAVIPEILIQGDEVKIEMENVVVEEKKEVVKKGSSSTVADDFIIDLWNAHVTYDGINKAVQEKFSNEHISTEYRIVKLRDAGRIGPRHKEKDVAIAEEKTTRREILQKRGGNLWPKMYSVEEDNLLVSLWNQVPKLVVSDIFAEFSKVFSGKRTVSAVGNRLTGLQNEGRIQPRWRIKPKGGIVSKPTLALIGEAGPEPILPLSALAKDGKLKETPIKIEVKPAPDVAVKIDDADAIVSLVKKFEILSEAYESISKGYIELKTKLEDLTAALEKKNTNLINWVVENYAESEKLAEIQKHLAVHEHSKKSGKAMLPLETST